MWRKRLILTKLHRFFHKERLLANVKIIANEKFNLISIIPFSISLILIDFSDSRPKLVSSSSLSVSLVSLHRASNSKRVGKLTWER